MDKYDVLKELTLLGKDIRNAFDATLNKLDNEADNRFKGEMLWLADKFWEAFSDLVNDYEPDDDDDELLTIEELGEMFNADGPRLEAAYECYLEQQKKKTLN
jgi:hypothetical protein